MTFPSHPRAALITGCSSGIGLATALALRRRGFAIWAGVRREESLRHLRAIGRRIEARHPDSPPWRPILMDVVSPADVQDAVRQIGESGIPLRAVVNNAGYGQFGALEDLSEEEFRLQWETNTAGLWRVSKACLPLLRRSGPGATIVQISSILGRIALPLGGAYAASKFAVEALSDSMRIEGARWGGRVVVVEPGPIATRFSENARAIFDAERMKRSPYAPLYHALLDDYGQRKRWSELPAEAVADVIVRAIHARRPQARYLVTSTAILVAWFKRFAPDRLLDYFALRYIQRKTRR